MTQSGFIFDFQREIVKYCHNDVDVLRRACLAFRKIFLERGSVCPFVKCTTIASTCMKVFRRNFLRGEEIGVIPAGGYRYRDNHSEFRIAGTPVDGYYETDLENETRRYVLQFHECFWHECSSCFRINRERKLNSFTDHGDTIDARFERTLAATWRLRRRGYLMMEKWECDFDREIRENNEMRYFLENAQIIKNSPLDPRDAFFGGRTGNIATRCDVAGTEKICYIDVCSLYPHVLKTGAFPIGHPKIYIGEECSELIGVAPDFDFNSFEGLIRCKVLPPRDLFHPVLLYRIRDKLLFALCQKFEGTWVSCELRKAVEKGYRVSEVSEIWQYKITRYNPDTRQGGLFTGYISRFLQLKQEASGWPNECVDDEAKERYLRQRLAALLTSPEHEITDILPINDEVIYVSWRLREEAVVASPQTNVVIAAFTTALARLQLYEHLELLNRRVLYDTDSCIRCEKNRLTKFKTPLRRIVAKRGNWKDKRKLLVQRDGFLPYNIGPILSTLLSLIIEGTK
ncbi:hypothetical protein ALC57_07532 [Trachymyrmex cornetzi]|uniref:DNA-directed DNA polymerase n=1 Tax=Trachymyrmex cornetzi TaxID=471704 RepID=A0A151J7X3_9HYME|nr:hypothetical protein ALC57_07532 [Trachymyrmex cornetzi]